MKKRKRKHSSVSATTPIDVIFGAFQVGEKYRVPYMTSILKLREVSEYLNLVTEDPKYATQDWSVTELFQREVEHDRVLNIADTYLNPNRLDRPAFFNSLTVVLKSKKRGKETYIAPEPDKEYAHFLQIGPITINYEDEDKEEGNSRPENGSFGVLQWNRDQVYAVAIDGQHRLAAIKHLWNSSPESARKSNVSVIFITIDPKIGFSPAQDRLKMMRSIFIDLNKHAVPVSRARNLLLDDNDPTALFLRRLFSSGLSYTPGREECNGFKVGKSGEFKHCLPLDLVDWHGESKSKVDEGPYVTSILALEWIVTRLLASGYPKQKEIKIRELSPDDPDYFAKVQSTLQVWKKSWDSQLAEHFKECDDKGIPLILTHEELKLLSEEFSELWGRPITRLLTAAGPYYDLAMKRLDSRTICPEFGQWYQAKAAYERNKSAAANIRDHYKIRLSNVEETLKDSGISVKGFKKTVKDIEKDIKTNSIFFFLVGQRALVYALASLVSSKNCPQWAHSASIDLEEFKCCQQDFYAFYLVEALNVIYRKPDGRIDTFLKHCRVKRTERELLDNVRPEFWAGSLLRREDPNQIDFSDAAAKRGAKWFVFIAHLYWFMKCNSELKRKDISKMVENLENDALQSRPFGNELIEASAGVCGHSDGKNRNQSPMAFLVTPPDEDDWRQWWKCVKAAFKERVRHLVNNAFDIPS